jgi:hypothetical protein
LEEKLKNQELRIKNNLELLPTYIKEKFMVLDNSVASQNFLK